MKRRLALLTPRTIIKALLLFLLVLYVLALTVPYIPHKRVSGEYQAWAEAQTFLGSGPGIERVAYIDNNMDALLCRLNLIEHAKEEIILSTFDFNEDDGGRDVLAALLQAARRGVRVRVIVDGLSGFLDVRRGSAFEVLAAQENVELRIYNPVNFLQPWKLQARLHDKYLIADRERYLLGGRNTMDLFLGDYSDTPNIDRELLVWETEQDEDASLWQLLDYFEQVWPLGSPFTAREDWKGRAEGEQALEERYPALKERYPEAFLPWDWEAYTFETNRISLLHNPVHAGNKEPWLWHSFRNILEQGEEAVIYTPYIICGKEMYQDITALTEGGLQLEVITNDPASGANPWGCTDYLNQKEKIWDAGVQVYEYMGANSCHTKAAVIDDRLSLVGSYNLDMRSTYQDTELMLVVDSTELNARIRAEIERDKSSSKTAGTDGEYIYGENYVPRELSTGKQIFYGILRVLTIPLRRFL